MGGGGAGALGSSGLGVLRAAVGGWGGAELTGGGGGGGLTGVILPGGGLRGGNTGAELAASSAEVPSGFSFLELLRVIELLRVSASFGEHASFDSINKSPLLLLWFKLPKDRDSKCKVPLLLVCPKLLLKDWLSSFSSFDNVPNVNDFREEAKALRK